MLNIISQSIVSTHSRGPRKVVQNLMRGLDQIGYPYVVNYALDATSMLWIHDDRNALAHVSSLPQEVKVVAGPNIYTVPREIPDVLDIKNSVWIYPSKWVEGFWHGSGYGKSRTDIWAVGIDTERFTPSPDPKEYALVYVKQRSEADVQRICTSLTEKKIPFKIIRYGSYTETEYIEVLKKTSSIIWIGRSESQGLALLEALAMNVPACIFDIGHFGEWEGPGKNLFTASELSFREATAAPYFDARCGLICKHGMDEEACLQTFFLDVSQFSPREYIEEHFTLAKQARAFIALYEHHFSVPYDESLKEQVRSQKRWRNAGFPYRVEAYLKDMIRKIVR